VDAFDIAEVGVAKAQGLALQACMSVRYAVADVGNLAWPEAVYKRQQSPYSGLQPWPSDRHKHKRHTQFHKLTP
jgi:hypothetical protein